MDAFERDITLISDDNWLGCFDDDNNVLEQYHPFDDTTIDENLLNLGPELCSLEQQADSAIRTTFPYDNVSESNSSDSGNYSPKSSSSEQQHQLLWTDAHQQPYPSIEAHNSNFSREQLQYNSMGTPQTSENCYYAEENVIFNETGDLNSNDTTYVNNNSNNNFAEYGVNFDDSSSTTPSCSQIYSSDGGYNNNPVGQPQQIIYIVQEETGSPNQLMTVSCINNQTTNCNNSGSIPHALISPAVHNSSNDAYTNSSSIYQGSPVKLYLNKRPIPRTNTFLPCATQSTTYIAEEEEFLRRKEDRKLRNRAAAQLSRQRKRNEFDQMKYKLAEKEEECFALKKSVEELRKKVASLEEENKRLLYGNCDYKRRRCNNDSSALSSCDQFDVGKQNRKKTAAIKTAGGVCALVFMAFIFFPTGDYKNDLIQIHSNKLEKNAYNDGSVRVIPKLPYVGHSLMSLGNYQASNGTYLNGTQLQGMRNFSSFTGCPNGNDFYNTTQNIRLNAELLNWIDRHDQMNFVQLRRGNAPSVIFNGRLTTDSVLETQKKFSKIFSEAQIVNNWTVNRTDLEITITNSRKALLKSEKNRVNKSNSIESNVSISSTRIDPKLLKVEKRKLAQQKLKLQREMTLRHLKMITNAQSNDVLQKHQQLTNVTAHGYSLIDFEKNMLEFTSKIQQKVDTLYVVALKDYFLLPALDNSKSAPKLSIILPALATNSSAPGQLTMMRIEFSNEMSARYHERISHIEKLLLIQNLVIDAAELRSACLYGIPDQFRPLCWRLFLDYLPEDRSTWTNVLRKQRDYYENLVDNLIIHPSSSASAAAEKLHNSCNSNFVIEEEVDDHPLAISSPLKPSKYEYYNKNDELPVNQNSEWATYFKDNEVLSQIDKDVRRLRPEMGFFQRKTMFPKRWSKFANLVKRIQFENLSADVPEIKLCTQSFINQQAKCDENAQSSSASSASVFGTVVDTLSHSAKENGSDINGGSAEESEMHWHVVERILFIYSKLNPGIKYVQGMNEIVGPIYFVFATDPDEEWAEHAEADTFYCFQNLMSEIKDNFIRTLDNSDCGIEAVLNRFYDRFREMDQELYEHLAERLSIKPQFYAFRWISLLLSQEFSLPDLIAVWDNVFSSRNRVENVEYICLAMIEGIRDELLNGDFGHNVRLLQNYPEVDICQLVVRAMELRGKNSSLNNLHGDPDRLGSAWSSSGGRTAAVIGQKLTEKSLSIKSKLTSFVANTQQRVMSKYSTAAQPTQPKQFNQ